MFSGIIEELGQVTTLTLRKKLMRVSIAAHFSAQLSTGNSVAVDGVCLTVIEKNDTFFTVEIHKTTGNKSTLGSLQRGQKVNLERAIQAKARFDGHFVQGHVNGVGVVQKYAWHVDDRELEVLLPDDLLQYCVPEGSITINGISLTIAKIKRDSIMLSIIPHTHEQTNLREMEKGRLVNIECDILGRYMNRLLHFSYLAHLNIPNIHENKAIYSSREARYSRATYAVSMLRKGKMIIVVDDETRENEGDFFKPACTVSAQDVNFMLHHGRGLICVALQQEQAEKLHLQPMSSDNTALQRTAFTESIDAAQGTTTGISAQERAFTIQKIADANAQGEDFLRPGHIFPIVADAQGLRKRRGHTEAAVMLSKEAGCVPPAGVICEILKDDGTMARWDDLCEIAERFSMPLVTIGDLMTYIEEKEGIA